MYITKHREQFFFFKDQSLYFDKVNKLKLESVYLCKFKQLILASKKYFFYYLKVYQN